MKSFLILLLSSGICLSAQAQYSQITVGTNNVTQPSSATIGNNNQITSSSATRNLLSGDSNWISSGSNSVIFGSSNGLASTESVGIVGMWNSGNGIVSTMIIGTANTHVSSDTSMTVGYNNYSTGWGKFLFGQGLTAGSVAPSNGPSLVVGTYNADKVDQRFVVGIGTSSTTDRRNAFEVYADGKVKIPKRQGDIVMGNFGNGNGD